ncbi:DNA-binding beta-propeller fold protein YncE [Chthoniobacter flavus]|uniref:Calx-beta domain-containing protein n=1 Tax=Chthoniobacter flavus TaxID=191863 RepID=UPI00105235A7|nr:Calx-beta domain-containing protein [Chthoniobacter flavus]TCO94115.1 DNA-binding beta-propeller fold protein YncE [Chthoniobacter flavus]
MKTSFRRTLVSHVLPILLLLAGLGHAAVVTPTVSILNFASTTVTISGLGFDSLAANNTVVFNQGVTGTVTAATATQLTVTLSAPPSVTGNLTAVVTTDGLSSGSPVTVAVIAPMVQFNPTSESVNATAGTFNVTATLTGNASFAAGASGTSSNFATGLGIAITQVVADAAGNIYALAGGALQKVTPNGTLTTVASSGGFNNPTGLAIDSDGNIYVSNNYSFTNTHNVIKLTPDGGSSFFIPDDAGLTAPTALVCDSAKNLYVGQEDGSIVQVTPAGVMISFATCPLPVQAMAVDSANNLYVSCTDDVIRKVTPAGAVSSFAAGFGSVFSMAFDSAGYLYAATIAGTNLWEFSQIAPDGTVAGNIPLNFGVAPAGVTFDQSGNLYFGNGTTLVQLAPTVSVPFTLGGTAQSGVDYTAVTSPLTIVNGQTAGTITGLLLLDPPTSQTLTFTLGTPTGASLGSATVNTMTIVEPSSAATVQFTTDSETVNQSAGTFSIPLTLTGSATPSFTNGALAAPSVFATNVSNSASASWLTIDSVGNLYVSNHNFGDISRISPSGVVTKSYLTSGGYFRKEGMAFDTAGNLYVATHDDSGAGSVIKMTPSLVITTFASGFTNPHGLAFDAAGNLYVANGDNTVRQITPAGVVSTYASGFSTPNGLAFDASGNLYVANGSANTISKVTPTGTVSTFATGFSTPYGIVTDSAGNLYVTNNGNGVINKVTPAGIVGRITGAFGGILSITQATGIVFDSQGSLYVSSYSGNDVLKCTPSVSVQYSVSGTAQAGKDYSFGILPTNGTVIFVPGQTTASISGTLLADPGASVTLTLTLNTPIGASLGATKSNAMTIVEPPPTVNQNTVSLPINTTLIAINGLFNRTVANNTVTFNNGAIGTVAGSVNGGGIIIGGNGNITSLTINLTTPPNQVGPLIATVSAGGVSSVPVQVATVVPVVTSTTTDLGFNTTTLTINGFGFDPIAANNTVTLNNGATGTVTAATATQLTIALTHSPTQTGTLTATVTTDAITSAANVPVGTAEPIAEFSTTGESADASVQTFSIPVQLTGSPTFDSGIAPSITPFATGFNAPEGMTFDTTGNLYVANFLGDSISKVTPDGEVSTFASGFPTTGFTSYPSGLAFDAAGNLYVALFGNNSVSKITPDGTISTDVPAMNSPAGVAIDTTGNLYATGVVSGSWVVSKITPAGAQSTFTFTQDNGTSLAFDAAGNLYVGTNDVTFGGQVTKVSPDGSTANLFASGFQGGPNAGGLAIDAAGNVYVANGTSVSKVTPLGVVSTFLSGLDDPAGLAFDTVGNLYVGTGGDNAVSKVAATSIVPFTVGGTAVDGTDYTGVTVGPLVFVNGQPTVYITGTLIHHPGADKTLTFTLGTPSGAVLGTTTTHTLTILNGPVVTSSTANLANDSATLTINGFNFDPTAANDTVTFNDGTVGIVTAASATQLTLQLSQRPTGLGSLTAVVNTGGQDSGTPVQIANVVPFANPTGITTSGGTVTLTFSAAPDITYQLQYTPSLTPASWSNIGTVTTNGAGTGQYIDTPPAGAQGYYRLTH